MKVNRWVSVAAIMLVVAGCTPASEPAESRPTGPATATSTGEGCGTTAIRVGGLPEWARSAQPPAGLPYVMSHEGNLVGVLFGHPLTAPARPVGRQNKVLWIVREPRNGEPLRLTLRSDAAPDPVTVREPPNSSPGEIFPSIVDVPTVGCWTVTAEWDGHRASLELPYVGP